MKFSNESQFKTELSLIRLMRLKDVTNMLKVSPSTIWRWRQKGHFPHPIQLSSKTIAWDYSAICDWLRNQSTLNNTGGSAHV